MEGAKIIEIEGCLFLDHIAESEFLFLTGICWAYDL